MSLELSGGGEDRLSALPDDFLVSILQQLGCETEPAARTSVLSRRWRHVWTLLPVLRFEGIDSHRLRSVLDEVPLRRQGLFVELRDASGESLAAWLPAAARRIHGELFVENNVSGTGAADGGEMEEEEEASQQGGTVELPCFENATNIYLGLGFLSLSMPPAGVFARLAVFTLYAVRFHGPGELWDAVSSPRCPCLHTLTIMHVRGLDSVAINSESLQQLNLIAIDGLRQITVAAPALRDFILFGCFTSDKQNQPVVNLSVPQLKLLKWEDSYDQSSVDLGSMEHLLTLETSFLVYGILSFTYNSACLMLLPRFEAIENLVLTLQYMKEINHLQYQMEGLTLFPKVTFLQLIVQAEGHSFGASSFHVLKFCSGIKRLMLVLSYPNDSKVPFACSSGCICDQQTNWKTEEISLNHLKALEIKGFRAFEHDIAFVKRLLNWMPVLSSMIVTFHCSVTQSKAKELVQMFQGFSMPIACIRFYIYQSSKKVLFAPED